MNRKTPSRPHLAHWGAFRVTVDEDGLVDVLAHGIGPVPEWSTRAAKIYIQVDDIDETLDRVEAAGNEIGLVEKPSN